MLTELHRKGGRVCQPAREGQLRCPLIVRPTSEDVITGHLALAFRTINPRWWLPDLLNRALGEKQFRRQVFRKFRVEPWRNLPPYPRELLPWDEGSTQVDLTLSWENPPTTIYLETKFKASLSPKTAGDDGSSGFPSDQVIRNIRVGLLECGWFRKGGLFKQTQRNFALVVLSPRAGHGLVSSYRDADQLRAAIPFHGRLVGIPDCPLVGEIDYGDVARAFRQSIDMMSRPERAIASLLTAYLQLKRRQCLP